MYTAPNYETFLKLRKEEQAQITWDLARFISANVEDDLIINFYFLRDYEVCIKCDTEQYKVIEVKAIKRIDKSRISIGDNN
jgi:hypothetical protein